MVPSSSLLWSVNLQFRCLQCTSKSAWGALFASGGGGGCGAWGVASRVLLAPAPALSVTVRRTEYCPAVRYECEGFRSVDVPPSPKSQRQLTIVPSSSLLRSVKVHVRLLQCTSNS